MTERSVRVHPAFTEPPGSVHPAAPVDFAARHDRAHLEGPELKLSTTTRAAAVTASLAAVLATAACGASNEDTSTPPFPAAQPAH